MNKTLSFILLFIFINSSVIATFNPVLASETSGDYWNTKTPMKQARHGLGVVAADSKIYAIGGFATDGNVVNTNERYDPKFDTWVTLEPMLTPRAWFAITACQGKIYCMGGTIYDKMERVTFGINEVYDTVTDSWSTKASLPYKGSTVQANVVDDKIFVIIDGQNLYMYDPTNDTWTKKADLPETPTGGALFASTVVGGKIIVTGDFSVENPPNVYRYQKVFIYDSKANRWSEGKTGPVVVQFCVVGATTGIYAAPKVYVLGLVYDSFSSVKVANQVYDPVGDSWLSAKALPTNRVDFGVAVVDDILYVIGGYTSTDLASIGGTVNSSALTEQYVPTGYTGTLPLVNLTASESKPSSTYLIVVALVLTVGIVVVVFFYLKKRRNKQVNVS